jgi:hypothetical protein
MYFSKLEKVIKQLGNLSLKLPLSYNRFPGQTVISWRSKTGSLFPKMAAAKPYSHGTMPMNNAVMF